jgi:hypothetical protein
LSTKSPARRAVNRINPDWLQPTLSQWADRVGRSNGAHLRVNCKTPLFD